MANNRSINELPKRIFTDAIPEAGVPSSQVTEIMGKLSMTCKRFNNMFKDVTPIRRLYQAVIDDDRDTVKKLLKSNPNLLLVEQKNLIIESNYTFQKFRVDTNESPLTIAVKLKTIKMIKLMLPYYDKIKDKQVALQARKKSLSAWTFYDTRIDKNNQEEIIIPEKYSIYMQSIIDVIKDETGDYQNLNEKTENKLKELFNDLLPKKPVKLNDYFDIELLLLAAYQAYRDNYDLLIGEQLQILAIRVIGLILTMQSPELAKIFCDSLNAHAEAIKKGEMKKIGKDTSAAHLKMMGGESFYRSSRDSHSGSGFNFLCGIFGAAGRWCGAGDGGAVFKSYVKQKHQIFKTYAATPERTVSVCNFLN